MRRYLEISKYRNLGLDTPAKLDINNSLVIGKVGDLIILVGPNNAGKSNVLGAIEKISLDKPLVKEKDVTTISNEESDQNPSLKIVYEGGGTTISSTTDLKTFKKIEFVQSSDLNEETLSQKELIDEISSLSAANNQFPADFLSTAQQFKDTDKINLDKFVSGIISSNKTQYSKNTATYNLLLNLEKNVNLSTNKLLRIICWNLKDNKEKAEEFLSNNYGINTIPNVLVYKEHTFTDSDLNSPKASFMSSPFFKSLLNLINDDGKSITNAYEKFERYSRSFSVLEQAEKKINEKLASVNAHFNKLYMSSTDKYDFHLKLTENSIYFSMSIGNGTPLVLSQQSTGFLWFFNFYFGFLGTNKTKPGDILILDEPATNLHVKGQKELRAFLKEFSRKNQLTIIMATHSPFFVDPDYFDELRIITSKNGKADINNIFTIEDPKNPDTTKNIINSLTIEQHVLYNPDNLVVFVEGLSDYCYLTCFKKFLGIEDLYFVPFNGVGKKDDTKAKEEIVQFFNDAYFPKKMLLVDGDDAGKGFEDFASKNVTAPLKSLDQLLGDDSIKEIEQVFSPTDRKNYSVLQKGNSVAKQGWLVENFKEYREKGDFDNTTSENFLKLFTSLENIKNNYTSIVATQEAKLDEQNSGEKSSQQK